MSIQAMPDMVAAMDAMREPVRVKPGLSAIEKSEALKKTLNDRLGPFWLTSSDALKQSSPGNVSTTNEVVTKSCVFLRLGVYYSCVVDMRTEIMHGHREGVASSSDWNEALGRGLHRGRRILGRDF